jgi:DnaJ-class molecular chaperone
MARSPEPSAADLYARLGIAPDASSSEINTAYRHLARALHPDSAPNAGGSPAQLRLVIEAHQILADPQQRQRYDSTTNRSPQSVSRSEPVTIGTCAVCRGTGLIGRPCHLCAGTGHVLTDSPWLRTPSACPACHARGHDLVCCGACGGSGRTSFA